MAENIFQSIEIALEQLETALRLYEHDREYFSVITLASAAEDILRKQCEAKNIETSLAAFQAGAIKLYRNMYPDEIIDEDKLEKEIANCVNHARNKAKHINPSVEPTFTVDAQEEARDILNRAIDNYWASEQNLTPAMAAFWHRQRKNGSI